jgi:hypothetical protein
MVTASKIRGLTCMHGVNRAVVAAGVLIAFVTGLVYCGPATWAGWFMPQQVSDASGQTYYQNAYTLIDLPSEDLVKALPELRGLAPAADQQQLPGILSYVGKGVEEFFEKFSQIVAKEQITQEQCRLGGRVESTTHFEFSYLLLPHYEGGEGRIREYRSDAHGNEVRGFGADVPYTEGFAQLWALFYPANQSGSRFRYLGQQQLIEQPTLVIGFAQKPGWSSIRGEIAVGTRSAPLLYQGVVWIDKVTYKILKIRVDLLKPRLDFKLEMQTAEIRFGEVHISDAPSSSLWVPLRLAVTTTWNGKIFRAQHLYSSYQLPVVETKIKSVGQETAPPP